MIRSTCLWLLVLGVAHSSIAQSTRAEGDWEITPQSEKALERGLQWLAANQGSGGNWGSNELGLVSMGLLAFLADGHQPGRGKYGETTERALKYILRNAKPSGLLNITGPKHDMYNHGLTTFVLGQVHGTTSDPRIGPVLDRALKLIANTQCNDGGWDYYARAQARGHDLSLSVMQAKALRSAMDSGLEVPREVVNLAIQDVRKHYHPIGSSRSAPEDEQRRVPGQFTYDGSRGTLAMAAAGVVCMQEFGQYDDWRIDKSMAVITKGIAETKAKRNSGKLPMDAYTLYYVGQALYQKGGKPWRDQYPHLRDVLVESQRSTPGQKAIDGMWAESRWKRGQEGNMWGTATACFVLAIPNRYLPILQEGKIATFRESRSKR